MRLRIVQRHVRLSNRTPASANTLSSADDAQYAPRYTIRTFGGEMLVVVATRMKIGRLRDVPRFVWASLVIALQARRSQGFLGGRLRVSADGALWTVTVWTGGQTMTRFGDSGVHATVVPLAETWASEAVFGVWNSATARVPSWRRATQHIANTPTSRKF